MKESKIEIEEIVYYNVKCPYCGHLNEDIKDYTEIICCEKCEEDFKKISGWDK